MKKLPFKKKRTSYLLPERMIEAMQVVDIYTEAKPSIQVRQAVKDYLSSNHRELLISKGYEDVWNPSLSGVESAE
jgi:hypothetical protein